MDAYEVNLARSAWGEVLSARHLLDNDIELVGDGDIHEAVGHLTNALAELENLMGDYKPAGGREREPPAEESEYRMADDQEHLETREDAEEMGREF